MSIRSTRPDLTRSLWVRRRLPAMLALVGVLASGGIAGSSGFGHHAGIVPTIAMQPDPSPYRAPSRRPLPALGEGQFAVQVEGVRQGKFKAEVEADGETPYQLAEGVRLEVVSPTKGKSGAAEPDPIILTRAVGAASPQFLSAALTGEELKSVVIQAAEVRGGSRGKAAYGYTLSGARVVSVRQYTDNKRQLEDVAIAFEKLDFAHAAGTQASYERKK